MTAHVVVQENVAKHKLISIRKRILDFLRDMNFEHTTLEFEYEDEMCTPC